MRNVFVGRFRSLWIAVLAIALSCFAIAGCAQGASEEGGAAPSSGNSTASVRDSQDGESSVAEDPESGAPAKGANGQGAAMRKIEVTVNGRGFTASLEENETSRAFLDLLPLGVEMQELNGNEKYHRLSEPLPSDPSSFGTIEAGDLMLYQDDCLVLFYETHPTTYQYTRIGKIDNLEGFADAVGTGSAEVDFKVE